MIAPQEMLTSLAVMVHAWSDATNAATLPTSAKVAVRFTKLRLAHSDSPQYPADALAQDANLTRISPRDEDRFAVPLAGG
jgi:hypothetical protein